MPDKRPLVMISAGEASGDCHGAALFRELQHRVPGVTGIGMGGAAMREAGIELCFDSSGIGVIGLAEILRHYAEIRGALKLMQRIVCARKPDLLICVDYKEFNFRLAKAAKACGVKVLFYVSPQVWAWRPGRVKDYGRVIDHMAVIFPFELPYYEKYGVPATYVGHPLAGKVRATLTRAEARKKWGLAEPENQPPGHTAAGPVVGLLPGSRANEIKRLLPVILEAAVRLAARYPHAQFLLFQAATVQDEDIADALVGCPVQLRVIKGQDYDALQCCEAVVTVSGTATLEVALMGVPMVIVYRLSPISYWLGRLLVKVPFIGLPNILAGKSVVKEFIQAEATAANIAGEVGRILDDAAYASRMRNELGRMRALLGERDGSVELARLAAGLLCHPAPP